MLRTICALAAGAALAFGFAGCSAVPATPSLGQFEAHGDVGATGLPGNVAVDPAGSVYSVTGGGANIWGTEDAFQYVYAQRSGNLHVASDIAWVGAGKDPHRKASLMIRQNFTAGSPYVDVMVHGDGLTSLQFREAQDGPTHQIALLEKNPKRVRLEYEDGVAYVSVSGADGVLHHAGGNFRISFEGEYFVGLAVSAHDNALTETAHFSNVEINAPTLAVVPDTGYPAAVESTLEVIDVNGGRFGPGNRRVVRHFNYKIEAPNWSRDGSYLIYNSQGHLYRISPEGGEPEMINTGPQVKNNNDHGISPDGTQLMISDQSEPDNISRIYTLPIEGSDHPRLVVSHPTARSYWHAWTPDGRTIAYTASRPEAVGSNDYDIWARDLPNGPERNLTHTMGLDDGPEFTPDGRSLYFNSTRSGNMQIWRANADGSNPVQVTFDAEYRDWFPHFSPDGKWMAFISFYSNDIPLDDHPPNRRVLIRIMPADGSEPPRILTRLFGGQGTMNVPSWSPDSNSIAFVSYRLVR